MLFINKFEILKMEQVSSIAKDDISLLMIRIASSAHSLLLLVENRFNIL